MYQESLAAKNKEIEDLKRELSAAEAKIKQLERILKDDSKAL